MPRLELGSGTVLTGLIEPPAMDGKEGVIGSSPMEGSEKRLETAMFRVLGFLSRGDGALVGALWFPESARF
jgi:hypothetical protein